MHHDINIVKVKTSIDVLAKENKELYDSTFSLRKRNEEFDSYNKALLGKIKELTGEKDEVIASETKRKNDIEKKCEEFRNDVVAKFQNQVPEKDKLREDNDYLRTKVQEYKASTDEIRINIESQLRLNEKDLQAFEDDFRKNMKNSVKNLEENANKFLIENNELKNQIISYNKKYEDLSGGCRKFNTSFDVAKRELERVS